MAFDAGSIVARLELNSKQWEQSIARIKADQKSLSGYVLRNEASFKNMGKAIAIAGGAVVASFGAMIKKTADYGDEMDELHQRTGASVEILTGLDGALKKNGASTANLAEGMRFLSNRMVDANSGNKEANALFKALGVSVVDANGNLRSTTDVLFDVSSRFAQMEDGAIKTTIAVDLLGKGGMSLIPTLNLGAEGLRKETEQAARLGKVMTAQAAKGCSDFSDRLVDLTGSIQGVGIQIGSALMPAIQGLVTRITNIVIKVRGWAAEHPSLAAGLSKVAVGMGALMMTLGPFIYALPGLIRGLAALKAIAANPIVIVVAASIPILTKAVADFTHEVKNMNESMRESGRSGFISFLAGVNSGWRRVALGIKDSNVVLSEANALGLLYLREGGKGTKDILLEATDAADRFTPALESVNKTTREVIETLTPLARGATWVRDVMQGFAGTLVNTFIPAARNMRNVLSELSAEIIETTAPAARNLAAEIKAVADMMPKVSTVSREAGERIKSVWQEVSTVVADAMRNIASAIVSAFNIKGLFGAAPKSVKFDSSYYDAMIAAATSAYEKNKALIESNVDALRAATDKEIDVIKAKYDAMEEAAKDAYDAQELILSRAQEDADIRLSRHEAEQDRIYSARYEREKRAIENSTMTEHQKQVALRELEKKFEAEERAREIAREDKKVARERRREDAKLRREERQERRLEAIRREGYLAEQALRDAAQAKEQAFLTNLLSLQTQHQLDLDAIRRTEDAARQKQADDEEKRQNSLWFKVKGIFATAVEEMATIWLTKFIGKLISGTVDAGTAIAKNVGGAVGDIAGAAGKAAGGFLSALGSVGSIISGITSVIELLKGPEKQTDVTYWLKLQWELLQNSYNFYIGELTWKLNTIRDALDIAMKPAIWIMASAIDNAIKPTLWSISEKVSAANGYLKRISESMSKITPAASGYSGTVSSPTMFMAGERGPERVQITPTNKRGGQSVNLTIHVNAIDRAGVETFLRRDAQPILQRMLNNLELRPVAEGIG